MKTNRFARPISFYLVALAYLACLVSAQKKLAAVEAKNHVGEKATVCGKVASTRYATSTKGQPTFLNLDKPFPDQIFTVLIWGHDHAKFGSPELTYKDKTICATGRITVYRGIPEIIANEPQQIQLQRDE